MRYKGMDDTEIITLVQKGDRDAAHELIRRYQQLVSHVVFHTARRPAMHDDLCQEVFIRVFENLSNFRNEAKLSSWISRIAFNHCINYLRSRSNQNTIATAEEMQVDIPDETTLQEKNTDKDMHAFIRREVDLLPQPYGLMLFLYHFQNFSYDEIGATLQLPEGTVKNYIFRARNKLRERLLKQFSREVLAV